jgi:DNA replication protein DnaC
MKPTILISNLAIGPLAEFAGDRVIDRMKENGGKLVVFDWKSHRGAA